MANAIRLDVEIQGLAALKRKLRRLPESVTEEFRGAMQHIADLAANRVRANAPVKTGALRASIVGKTKKSGFPSYAVVRATAKRKRVNYGRILEFSPRFHHVKWMRAPVYATPVAPALNKAAQDIERKWGR
jgi:Bacteriophage HK97-gp10, putative tail-component